MRNRIVIDLGLGDSGKGVVTDNLCGPCSLVVRFSSGPQCGHTVIRGGIKHIFSSFGAGTLRGCDSFFTEDTCINPMAVLAEYKVLKDKGVHPTLYVHPLAKVITPFDVFSGRVRERRNNHGSCGLGVGATMKRNESPVKLYAVDLLAPKWVLQQKLNTISSYYADLFYDLKSTHFDEDLELFYESVTAKVFQVENRDLSLHSSVVFEGSQGILLDMDHGIFPHVTYTNTTSKNALKYIKGDYEVFYVTRCYSTRHGNGPFSEKPIKLINTEEEINVTNKWQGSFRIGEIDYDMLRYAIQVDKAAHKSDFKSNLVVTCLDQRPGFIFDYSFNDFNSVIENFSAKCENFQLKKRI